MLSKARFPQSNQEIIVKRPLGRVGRRGWRSSCCAGRAECAAPRLARKERARTWGTRIVDFAAFSWGPGPFKFDK